MTADALRLALDGGVEVSAAIDRAADCRGRETAGLVLGHGANNDLNHPLLAVVAGHVSASGAATVLRFNFPYMERGANSPDSPGKLESAYRRAHDALIDDEACPPGPMFLGGKSLGARIAAELVSRHHEGEGLLAAGLVFLGYPLHAPGRKDRLRLEPLRRIDVPSLFFCGTRDPLCDLGLLRPVVEGLDHPGTVVVVEGGDHSLEPARSSGGSAEEARLFVAHTVEAFIREHSG